MASSIFDPLGFLAPFVLNAKEIMQDLCRIRLEWDEEISDEYSSHWKNWLADLLNLSAFTVSHCLKPAGFGQVRSSQLHPFSDASEAVYGSASYLPLVNDKGKIHCSFLFSKSRVAPLKTVSIPRLELSATTVSVRQDRMLKRELDMPLNVVSVF